MKEKETSFFPCEFIEFFVFLKGKEVMTIFFLVEGANHRHHLFACFAYVFV